MLVYDNFKSHKKQGFMLSLENTFLETPRGSGGGGGSIWLLLEAMFYSSPDTNGSFLYCSNSTMEKPY